MARDAQTVRRLKGAVVAAISLAALGVGVRIAEYRQVGYTNDTSMWIFVAAGLCAYYAGWVFFRSRRGRR